MNLREEIFDVLKREVKPKELTDKVIQVIEKRIDKLYPENPIDTQYKTGYYNAIVKVKKELLK